MMERYGNGRVSRYGDEGCQGMVMKGVKVW